MVAGRFTIGLISDTHGLLRPEALAALQASDAIIHAGDIGDPAILTELARVAPVTAVRGNIDRGAWATSIATTELVELGGAWIYVIHDIADFRLDPAAMGCRVVVAGHSHKPGVRELANVLYVNPGSAGPRRFSLPISLGRLVIEGDEISVELIELEPTGR
ncbi:MAG TPA: metallophosphoesterase family protein [Aliidongia sp.]|nr:metallophosphoesterase family protein [Aliidongia sp.]